MVLFRGTELCFGIRGSQPPWEVVPISPPVFPVPYLGEPILVSEVGSDRGPLCLALGKLGVSLHPVNHTGQL